MEECCCYQPPFHYLDYVIKYLGMDANFADASVSACKLCHTHWLKYLIEEEHYSKSGRRWRVKLTSDHINKEDAKAYIEQQKKGFIGGFYFESTGQSYDYGPVEVR